MILSQACQYGLQAVLFLALQKSGPVTSRDIATRLGLPSFFLAKILQDLGKSGLLVSLRGRRGGFKLVRPASQIKLREIVLAIEGPGFGQQCLLGLAACSEEVSCPIHAQWAPIKEKIWHMLDEKSLQELIEESAANKRWLLPNILIQEESES